MTVIGLTGGSGSGKSLVASILAERGIPVIDADRVYHTLLEGGGVMTEELVAAFGRDIVHKNGRICRKALAAAVFGKPNTPALLHTLNTITHKYVMREAEKMLSAYSTDGARAVLLDAPQLFEANADRLCDVVIGVIADEALRLARILARDGITEDAARKRLTAQKSDDFFRQRCDYILENNGDRAALRAEVALLLKKIGVE